MKESIKICGRIFIVESDSQVHNGVYKERYVHICNNVPSYVFFHFDKKTVNFTGDNLLYGHTEKSLSDFLSMCDYMSDPINFFLVKEKNLDKDGLNNARYERALKSRELPYVKIDDCYKFENYEAFYKAVEEADHCFYKNEYGYNVDKLIVKILVNN